MHAWLVRPALDEVLIKGNKEMLFLIPLAIIIVTLCKGIATYTHSFQMSKVAHSVIAKLQTHMFEKLMYLNLDYFNDSRKVITIRDILNMSSGLNYPDHQHETMFFKSDQLKYSKKIKLQKEPNTLFEYNNVNSMLIGDILYKVTGKKADTLLKERILDPSNTKNYKLWKDEAGNTLTYCCIDMSAREYSRFGLLFARNGNWNGNQIIPKSYVDETFQVVWETPNWFTDHKRYYSMHWWVSNYTEESKIFNASGKFGQYIFVDRENDIVVTRITKYPQRDLGDIQKWGPLKTFSWLGVKTSIVISRFLLDTGIIKEGRNVVTPVTLEEGESSKFYKNYQRS